MDDNEIRAGFGDWPEETMAKLFGELPVSAAYQMAFAMDIGRDVGGAFYFIGDELIPVRAAELEDVLAEHGIKVTTIRLGAVDRLDISLPPEGGEIAGRRDLARMIARGAKLILPPERSEPDYLQHDPTKRHRQRREPRGHRYARKGFWA